MNNRNFWLKEMRSILTTDEYKELDRLMRRLLSMDFDLVPLSAFDELLADYGLEPDYLLAWIG